MGTTFKTALLDAGGLVCWDAAPPCMVEGNLRLLLVVEVDSPLGTRVQQRRREVGAPRVKGRQSQLRLFNPLVFLAYEFLDTSLIFERMTWELS